MAGADAAHTSRVDQKRGCPGKHRARFDGGVNPAFFQDGERQRGQRHRRSGAKESREGLGLEEVPENRKSRNDGSADEKSNEYVFQRLLLMPLCANLRRFLAGFVFTPNPLRE